MSLISKMRRQKALLWKNEGLNGMGKPIHGAPSVIDCRWENSAHTIATPTGESLSIKCVVYTEEALAQGDLLCLGTQNPLLDGQDPIHAYGVHKVLATEAIPNLKATETLHAAHLS